VLFIADDVRSWCFSSWWRRGKKKFHFPWS